MSEQQYAMRDLWERLLHFLRMNLSLTVIVIAAALLELAMGVMYYSAQGIIQKNMQQLVEREMNAIFLSIRNKLDRVEVTVDNMEWVVKGGLADPESMFTTCRNFVEHNPVAMSCCILFMPNYYPEKGYWFEPFAYRKKDGTIVAEQIGSAAHDYTAMESYRTTMERNDGYWCEPYRNADSARTMVTSYMIPVHDAEGKTVAVVAADIPLGWLEDVIRESCVYKSTQRFMVTRQNNLLGGSDNETFRGALNLLKADADRAGYETMVGVDGEKQHVFYYPMGGKADWILISVCNDSEIFGELRMVRLTLLVMILAGLVILTFIVMRTKRNLARLRLVNAEKERIGTELHVASRIQQSMLPQSHWRQDNVDIAGSLVPAREVGGDLFDYFVRNEKLFFCIGDVSGKGAASALLMAVVKTKFRDFSVHENNPARIMENINVGCCQNNKTHMFVTLFIGVLDLPTGYLRYCNAGHDAPFIVSGNDCSSLDVIPNLPVGVFDDFSYVIQETQLSPDSMLFLYTDGLTEARNEAQEQFGRERVGDVLTRCADLHPQAVLEKVAAAIHGFVNDAEQGDDLTMLDIRYMPQDFKAKQTETLVLMNDVYELEKLAPFISSAAEKMGIDELLAGQIRLAVEEAVANVINYGYPAGCRGDITIAMMSDGSMLRIQIVDTGVSFDPTSREKADITLPLHERPIGGLGILLVHGLMDTVNYERQDGKNILTLVKRYASEK